MKLIPLRSSSILHVLLLAALTAASAKYDHYLVSCGAPSTVSTTVSTWDYRKWYSDNNSTYSENFSSTMAASITKGDLHQIPFSTARVFTSNFTYSFPVSPGPKFIRLFFYPSVYSSSTAHSISATEPYITVHSNSGHLLLRNFSAYLSVNLPSYDYVRKEFYVHVSNSRLELTLFPTSPSPYAFINGIEVVSVPENLYYRPTHSPEYVPQQPTAFDLNPSTALETAYRVNVGGSDVSSSADSGNMARLWVNDYQYLIGSFIGVPGMGNQTAIKYIDNTPNYSAPPVVYNTMRWMGNDSNEHKLTVNLTWGFNVDVGFNYLVRLHWCDIATNSTREKVFDVFINDDIAERAVDIFGWVSSYTAMYRDYVVYMDPADAGQSKGSLQLAMHPNTDKPTLYVDSFLNGLEIYKISKPDGSLDAPNPSWRPPGIGPNELIPSIPTRPSHVLPAIIGAVSGAALLIVIIYLGFHFRRGKWSKMSAGSSGTTSSKSKRLLSSAKSAGTTRRSSGGGSSLPSHLCRYFSLADIRIATSDFSDSLIIGHGGFGNVYKGTVNSDTGPITVAIKRLNPLSGQGAREFTTEIELLSKLRHLHLVSFIGYCDDAGEMILVYEFMSHGTLRDHLYPDNTDQKKQLPWCQRLQICVGAARGLHYLHTGTERMIIHRDVKSTNILLDEKRVAKVSDFGLSKLGPTGADYSHVSTAVKGSFGYVDPEYYRRKQLTEKSDVYSFGVVLFEVLCARAAVNPTLPKEQVNLRIWARRNQVSGTLDTIVDPTLKGQIVPECLRKFGEVAESCVRDEGAQRPSMADVILGLEFALQLQLDSAAKSIVDGDDNPVDKDNVTTTNITSPTTDTTTRLIMK